MRIISFCGGFGNQMFQYAFYKKHTKLTREVCADLSSYENANGRPYVLSEAFPNIEMRYDSGEYTLEKVLNRYNNRNILQKVIQKAFPYFRILEWEREDYVYNPKCMKRKNCLYRGFWQTEKYWKDIADEIRADFEFAPITDKKVCELAEVLRGNETVSVHIRRGDYLSPEAIKVCGGICTKDYYDKAINYIRERFPDCLVVFFSDEPEWVRENFKISNAIIASDRIGHDYPDWYDMYLMTCCKHHIIANSSFSWWGAYLGHNVSKIVIAPSKWGNNKPTPDIWADGWIKI